MTSCPSGGVLSNSCPYSSSSSTHPPSSSSSSFNRSSSSSVGSSDLCAGFVDGTTREHYGKSKAQFCDSRDGKKYVYVTIGEQVWMAENLNYDASGSKCYNNDPAKCTTYGRLYNWTTAMANSASSTANPSGVRGVCPESWHLPSDAEWGVLMQSVNPNCSLTGNCANAGTKLKAISGWNSYSGIPAGSDTYGFTALPSGYGDSDGSFDGVGYDGSWCNSSEYGAYYYSRIMNFDREMVRWEYFSKSYLRGVRCVKD